MLKQLLSIKEKHKVFTCNLFYKTGDKPIPNLEFIWSDIQ